MRVFRHYVSPAKVFLASADALMILAAGVAVISLRLHWFDETVTDIAYWYAAPLIFAAINAPLMIGLGVYAYESLRNFRAFLVRLIVSYTLGFLVISAFLYLVPTLPVWRSFLPGGFVLAGLGVLTVHAVFAMLAGQRRFKRRTIIVGAGSKAASILGYLADDLEFGMVPVAVFPLEQEDQSDACSAYIYRGEALIDLVKNQGVDSVIIATNEYDLLPMEDLITLRLSGVDVIGHQAFYEEMRGYVTLEDLRPEWLLFADGFKGATALELGAKRALDIVVATSLLVLSAPLWLPAGLLVTTTSKGGMFYRQQRVGLLGKPFNVLKLRTMVADAEKGTGAKWAQENDPRITPIGRFLRASRIDEIPQVLNVLRGDMSFVGPRPERPEFVKDLENSIPFYRERHFVKPGITGWAQIRFPYGASEEDARRKLEYDLYYIKNYSLFLDLLIILQTARVVLFQRGAR